jgi:hypothetical protein
MPGMPGGWAWDMSSLAALNSIAATPPNFMNSLRSKISSWPVSADAAKSPWSSVEEEILSRQQYRFKAIS